MEYEVDVVIDTGNISEDEVLRSDKPRTQFCYGKSGQLQ